MAPRLKYLLLAILFFSCEGPLFEIPPEPDTTAPLVVITNPANEATLSDSVLITIYASDNDAVKQVQLFINDSIVYDSSSYPFEYVWNTTNYEEDEYHYLRAKAIDFANNDNQTNPVKVLVDNTDNIKPTGSLLYPFSGQTLNGTVSIIVEASDNDSLSSVVFYINEDSVDVKYNPPFIYNWDTTLEFDDYYYVINVRVNDADGNHITLGPISVYIDNEENVIVDTTPPTGNIVYPPIASILSGSVTIQVDAFDNEQVEKVDIVIDGSFTHTDESAPYEYVWNTTTYSEDMDHFISATVSDTSGNTTNLMPVTVFVDNEINVVIDNTPPSVVITSPAANQTVSGNILVTAAAFDNVEITHVEFYHDNNLITTDNTYPYETQWNTTTELEESEHIWYAKTYDTSDLSGQSQSIAVYVDNEDNVLPVGLIAQPYAGQSVSGSVDILISASDNVGVSSVDLYINGESITTLTQDPFIYTWNTLPYAEDNEHFISAKINDQAGNFYNVQPIAVTVNNDPALNDNIPPVISIITPVSGQQVGDSLSILIYAQDNSGIDRVILNIDNEQEITLSDSPYVHIWNTFIYPNESNHIISATAIDLNNNQTVAQSISVTVSNFYTETVNNLSTTPGVNEITLSWEDPFNAQGYYIYRDGDFLVQRTENDYTDDSVVPGTVYCYQVSAYNNLNIEGPLSEQACSKALIPAPENLSGVIDQNNITLSWTGNNQASQYRIYRDGNQVYSGVDANYIDSNLEYNASYSYTVSCLDNNGTEGPISDAITLTTHEIVSAPTLSLSVSFLNFQLNWSSIANVQGYKIYLNDNFLEEVSDVNTYLYTGTDGITGCFEVSAINNYNTEGTRSNEECGTGSIPILETPTLSLTTEGLDHALNWTTVTNANAYRVYLDGVFYQELTSNSLSFTGIADVTNCFEISGVDIYNNEGPKSNEECGTGAN